MLGGRSKRTCRLFLAALAGLALFACSRSSPNAAEEGPGWPRWRGPDGDGVSRETGWNPKALEGGPRLLWETDIGAGYSSVAVLGNRVYTMGGKGENCVVWCLNADSGKTIWKYSYPNHRQTPQATPSVDGESVYALGMEGLLFCLDRRNGKLRWKKDLVADFGALKPVYGFGGSPVVEGDLVLVTANTAGMAVNRKTGQLAWGSETPPGRLPPRGPYSTSGTGYATPVIHERDGQREALFTSWKGVCSVSLESGTPRWLYSWGFYTAGQGGDPVVVDGRILLTSDAEGPEEPSRSVLLDVSDAQPRIAWKTPELWTEFGTPVIVDGYIYSGHSGPTFPGGCVLCIDLATGKLMWKYQMDTPPRNRTYSLMAADGKLLILDDLGNLAIAEANPSQFVDISHCDVLQGAKKPRQFWTPPVLCDGRIYCRNYSGNLICIDVSK